MAEILAGFPSASQAKPTSILKTYNHSEGYKMPN